MQILNDGKIISTKSYRRTFKKKGLHKNSILC